MNYHIYKYIYIIIFINSINIIFINYIKLKKQLNNMNNNKNMSNKEIKSLKDIIKDKTSQLNLSNKKYERAQKIAAFLENQIKVIICIYIIKIILWDY